MKNLLARTAFRLRRRTRMSTNIAWVKLPLVGYRKSPFPGERCAQTATNFMHAIFIWSRGQRFQETPCDFAYSSTDNH